MTEESIILESISEHIKTCCRNNICTKQAFIDYINNMSLYRSKCKAAKKILNMRALKEPKMEHVWNLIREDDLYETLLDADVPCDWFAFAVCSYIYRIGDMNATPLISRFYTWQKDERQVAQDYFNEFIKLAMEKLAVFYD